MSKNMDSIEEISSSISELLSEPDFLREHRLDCAEKLRHVIDADSSEDKKSLRSVSQLIEQISKNGDEILKDIESDGTVNISAELAGDSFFVSFSDLTSEQQKLLERYYWSGVSAAGSGIYDYFRGALRTGGNLLYIAPAATFDEPLEITLEQKNIFKSRHLLVIGGKNSDFKIVRTRSASPDFGGAAGNVEVVALADSKIQYADFQAYSGEIKDSGCLRVAAHQNSRVDLLLGKLGRGDTDFHTCGSLLGEKSEIYSNEAVLARGNQEVISRVTANHLAGRTREEMITRGVVTSGASGEFNGKIKVKPEARKVEGSLHERALMVGEDSHASAVPGLQISDNDVRVSHSASVGEVDSEHMFYMRSRGLDQSAVQRLVIQGFFRVLLENISEKKIKNKLQDMIDKSLGELND